MKILVDMDGVIADFEGGFLRSWQTQYPDKIFIPIEERTTFYVAHQHPPEMKELVRAVFSSSSFYRSLDPIDGSIRALSEMRQLGHEVFICTSPLTSYQNCVLEKYEWVDAHFGEEWVTKIILSKDKTMIKGDILIDDRPTIDGCSTPSWEHILYDQPYNRKVSGKKRLNWNNWKDVLFPITSNE